MKKQYIFGIDLGGTTAKLGLFTQHGELLCKWEIPTDTRNHGENILHSLTASVRERMRIRQIDPNDVHGVGLATPGTVTQQRNVGPGANLDGWGGFDVADAFARLCGLPVRVANDANAAALGEAWQGSAKGAQNMLLVTIGTGLGSGVIVNGHILEGAHGAGGEIGHMQVRTDETRVCGCGKRGCLEQYVSATGLVYAAETLLASTREPSSLRQCGELSAKRIFADAKRGDGLASRLTENLASELGRALAAVSCVCDPEVIVLGGGVSGAGAYLLNAVQKAFIPNVLPTARETVFRLATLGNDAGIYGAARLVTV